MLYGDYAFAIIRRGSKPDAPRHPWTADFDGFRLTPRSRSTARSGLSEISRRPAGAAGHVFAADADFGLAHCLKGYFAMLSYKQATCRWRSNRADRAPAEREGDAARAGACAALERWIAGDLDRALGDWEADPRRASARRAGVAPHALQLFLARARRARCAPRSSGCCRSGPATCRATARSVVSLLRARGERRLRGRRAVGPRRDRARPGRRLGRARRRARARDAGPPCEGIAWLAGLEPHWDGGNYLLHHLWWHRALFHLERREFDAVLELYDRRFRNLASPLTAGQPDLYVDVQNAASMLLRLELHGVAVGARWDELADKAEARIGDCLSALTLPHWMMALAAAGRDDRRAHARCELKAESAFARVCARWRCRRARRCLHTDAASTLRRSSLMRPPIERHAPARRQPRAAGRPAQLFLDAAMKAERDEDVRLDPRARQSRLRPCRPRAASATRELKRSDIELHVLLDECRHAQPVHGVRHAGRCSRHRRACQRRRARPGVARLALLRSASRSAEIVDDLQSPAGVQRRPLQGRRGRPTVQRHVPVEQHRVEGLVHRQHWIALAASAASVISQLNTLCSMTLCTTVLARSMKSSTISTPHRRRIARAVGADDRR